MGNPEQDARGEKDHFVIVDAVGVCEQDKTDSRSMEQKPTVSFEKLLQAVTFGNIEDDVLTSLAGRLARITNLKRNVNLLVYHGPTS